MQILQMISHQTRTWDSKHTSSALQIVSEHIKKQKEIKLLEIEAQDKLAARKQTPWLILLVSVVAVFLSWIFLKYDKPEFIGAVLTGISAFAGGYGTAKSTKRKTTF